MYMEKRQERIIQSLSEKIVEFETSNKIKLDGVEKTISSVEVLISENRIKVEDDIIALKNEINAGFKSIIDILNK